MKEIDPHKLSCKCVSDRDDGTREIWIRYNGEVVAIGTIPSPQTTGFINARNKNYEDAARSFLKENFPEYTWG